jgi:predicted RNase H-like HicB family nuclease
MTFHILVREEAGGLYWAEVKEMPGLYSCGPDLAELLEAVLEELGQRSGEKAVAEPSLPLAA